jgi:hypothetical protein
MVGCEVLGAAGGGRGEERQVSGWQCGDWTPIIEPSTVLHEH